MDPGHRDRIAFMRICSGEYQKGVRTLHVRSGKEMKIPEAITFLAADRQHAESAYAGDIIGIHNHGTINIGDSFTQGEEIRFTGIPNFAPEIFRRAVLKDPLRLKALQKGLAQLCEEGATQLFKPLRNNDLILGAVGPLQFEVVAQQIVRQRCFRHITIGQINASATGNTLWSSAPVIQAGIGSADKSPASESPSRPRNEA